ncbi:MAG: efflux RND transporter periplasmic adaptor subunit [Bacteroidales bacterium]|jgi:HlyD family secretion protein|nr:efflux RND transporter periplasmic adaptor subunit [Bacteroidales bacterium]
MKKLEQSTISLLVGLAALLLVIIVLVVIGWLTSSTQKLTIQGTVEAREYRVSGKVAGRVEQLLYQEGDTVSKGQIVVRLDSPELQAKIVQANAQSRAARAQRAKASGSARSELVEGAFEQWQKAKVGVDIARKSYERVENLYRQEVVSAQKRDEAKAQYDAAVATEKAAFSQYNLAKNGAQAEDKMAAQAAVDAANASVDQVNSYIDEINLVSPITGVITEVFPKVGELVGQGAPIMTVTDINDVWFSFNIREDMLKGITMGSKINVKIPALGDETYQAEVYFINVMASFATWKPTKASGEFDAKTFEVRARPVSAIPHLRAGMSAIVK